MNYRVKHLTEYNYEEYVSYCHNIASLKPRNALGQKLVEYKLDISPKPTELTDRPDFFGNTVTRFSIQEPHKKLSVLTESVIERNGDQILEIYNENECQKVSIEQGLERLKQLDNEILDAKQYCIESPLIRKVNPLFKDYALESFAPNRSIFDAANELMERIFTDFKFDPTFTTIATPLDELIEAKRGVCQDFAHVAIACIRQIGLPARYVSGYIETLPPEGQEKLVGVDASHAWFSIYIPGYSWVDFDPTNNTIPADQHLVTAWGRDYHDVPPLKGVIYTNGNNSLKVSVDIARLEETPA